LIKKLVYKRGYGKVNGQRIPLTDNSIVEGTLGKIGLASVEDLIHEIVTVGGKFKQANNFLWPFKLSSSKKGFAAKRNPTRTVKPGVTERSSSTTSSRECSERHYRVSSLEHLHGLSRSEDVALCSDI